MERRILVERACRGVALAALGVLLWRAWHSDIEAVPVLRIAQTSDLRRGMASTLDHLPSRVELTLDSLPGPAERDWLRALSRSGSAVAWRSGRALGTPSVTVEALPEPSGRARVTVVGVPGTAATLWDVSGLVDSTKLGKTGYRSIEATIDGQVSAHLPGAVATTILADSLILRPVLVLARAGWEGKFVAAALEEHGWTVEARFVVSPGALVQQGALRPPDTSRYSAVLALDETAAPLAERLVRFVRSGGGVIVGPAAAHIPVLAALLPARPGDTLRATLGALTSDVPRRGLRALALNPTSPEAVVLERRNGAPTIVAARQSLGRVLLLGYEDTWRWRMEGGDNAMAEHRAWWSQLVSSVAYAPALPLSRRAGGDEAPYATLVDALGRARLTPFAPNTPLQPERWNRILLALLFGGLLAEWSSRRLRGAR